MNSWKSEWVIGLFFKINKFGQLLRVELPAVQIVFLVINDKQHRPSSQIVVMMRATILAIYIHTSYIDFWCRVGLVVGAILRQRGLSVTSAIERILISQKKKTTDAKRKMLSVLRNVKILLKFLLKVKTLWSDIHDQQPPSIIFPLKNQFRHHLMTEYWN